MKEWSLEIQECCWGPDPGCYYSKGHHAAEAFCKAVQQYEASIGVVEDTLPIETVVHDHWRTLPATRHSEYDRLFDKATPGTPGAYPVTIIYP